MNTKRNIRMITSYHTKTKKLQLKALLSSINYFLLLLGVDEKEMYQHKAQNLKV